MTTSTRTPQRTRRQPRVGPAFPVIEAKLSVPPSRPGVIRRDRLLKHLRASAATPVVTMIAPPGYGKTTLLAQWAETDGRPIVWITLDNRDSDPAVLLTYLAVGLDRIRPLDRSVFAKLTSPATRSAPGVVRRLVAAIQGWDPKPLIVFDDTHMIGGGASLDAAVELAAYLPQGSQLAIGGRSDIVFPLAALRARGRLLEIGPSDLALDDEETGALLEAANLYIPAELVKDIVRRTEGWPAAAYLAALSFGSGGHRDRLEVFTGADRFMSDYVWSEILERVQAKDLRFLTRTSVLDRMCGALCDQVTRGKGSAETLERLESATLLLVPLDRRREWYRYHQLFRDVLRAELDRREPDRADELQRRAAAWYEQHEVYDAAIEYYISAGDAERVARLVLLNAQPMYRVGRVATLQRWFGWLEDHNAVAGHGPLAVLAGWVEAMTGNAAGAERWAAAAERSSLDGPMPDGSPSIESWITMLRALRCIGGVAAMREDAGHAVAEIPPTAFFHPIAVLLLGVALTLNGEEGGEGCLEDAAEAAIAAGAHPGASLALGLLASSMASRGDWASVGPILERAFRVIDEGQIDDYWTSALAYALRARLALRQGGRERAREDLTRAQRLRPVLTHAIPWNSVQARLEMVRAYIALPDMAGARTLLREIGDILQRAPGLGTLLGEVEEARLLIEAMPGGASSASSLTAAELRLLPYLHTYMSFREIAQRLFVSTNTVKTQAISLYRKLGVSSRAEAMVRAEELGLIER